MRKQLSAALGRVVERASAATGTALRTGGALAWSVVASPRDRMGATVRCDPGTPRLAAGVPLKVLTWNVQFAAGRRWRFFYDGGDAVSVPAVVVRRTLERLTEVIAEADPDLVVLQEVDRGSRRTARIDQHAELVRRLGVPCDVSTPYFRSPYVPYPPQEHLGRIDMHLSVLSRVAVRRAVRWPLPRLHEGWLRRQFNLRRALLEVELPLAGGGTLLVFDTHLSAFSRGDGTLDRQVERVGTRLEGATTAGTPSILAGDFNALPPGDDLARLGPDRGLYADGPSEITPLFERWTSAVDAQAHHDEPARWRTWLPFGAEQADRAIDHVFCGPGVRVRDVQVLTEVTDVSDHLPVLATLEVSPP